MSDVPGPVGAVSRSTPGGRPARAAPKVELLVIASCPHEAPARALIHEALDELGIAAAVETTTITTQDEAAAYDFRGSPTIVVDGVDVAPQPRLAPAIACRVYRTSAGSGGLPDLTEVVGAVRAAADAGKQRTPSRRSLRVTERRPPAEASRETFVEVVEPEIEVLLRVAGSLTASAADAEDLVQETLLRAYRALDRFDGRHPRAWLLTILRHTNANMHRRRRPGAVGDWEVLRAARPAFGRAELPSAEETFVDGELSPGLDAAVRGLDPRFRAALVLVDVHDLSYADAATVLGVPVGTVMSRLSRARDRVRKKLGHATFERGELT